MPQSVEFSCVPPAKVHSIWGMVSRYVDRAVSRCGDWTARQIHSELISGRMLLWVAIVDGKLAGAVVTSLNEDRRRRLVCNIVLCGGTNIKNWLAAARFRIERFARDEKCSVIRMEGRQGWRKLMPDLRVPYTVLEKRLD